jgi:hypothetical protein
MKYNLKHTKRYQIYELMKGIKLPLKTDQIILLSKVWVKPNCAVWAGEEMFVKPSMGIEGDAYDNVMAEGLFVSLDGS